MECVESDGVGVVRYLSSTGHPSPSFHSLRHTQRALECHRAHREVPLVKSAAYHSFPNLHVVTEGRRRPIN